MFLISLVKCKNVFLFQNLCFYNYGLKDAKERSNSFMTVVHVDCLQLMYRLEAGLGIFSAQPAYEINPSFLRTSLRHTNYFLDVTT